MTSRHLGLSRRTPEFFPTGQDVGYHTAMEWKAVAGAFLEAGPGDRLDAADVRVKEILAVEGLASQFGIEVETTSPQSAAAKDFVERHYQVFDGVRKLVRVPPVLRIAAVGVDRPHRPCATA